jgi:hypothetical protein
LGESQPIRSLMQRIEYKENRLGLLRACLEMTCEATVGMSTDRPGFGRLIG